MTSSVRRSLVCIGLVVGTFGLIARGARADQIPTGWTASHMTVIGYTGLQGRGGAEKLAIKAVNGRWYLYAGQLWTPGLSIVDVTDPANPTLVKFVPGPANTWMFQVDLHDNILVTALQNIGEGWGGDSSKPNDEGVLIWDISDPVNPKLLSHWKTGSTGTHRDGYPGGRYVNLAANMPGFSGQILVFLDISDPKNPKEASRWWMPGQKEGEPPLAQPVSFHGPAIIEGNTAYAGYGTAVVILDISDISKPKLVGQLDVSPPFGLDGVAVHDVLKVPGRPLLLAHSESIAGDSPRAPYAAGKTCEEPLPLVGMVDLKNPAKPRLMSLFPVPVPPANAPYTDFCDKGGRFGPHNTNLEYHLPDVEHRGDLVYLTYFNAGVRIFDIKNPRMPKEVAWFIPPTPTKRYGPIPDQLVTQTEDVLVDRRGNIYITDKQWGIWIVRQAPGATSPAAPRKKTE